MILAQRIRERIGPSNILVKPPLTDSSGTGQFIQFDGLIIGLNGSTPVQPISNSIQPTRQESLVVNGLTCWTDRSNLVFKTIVFITKNNFLI